MVATTEDDIVNLLPDNYEIAKNSKCVYSLGTYSSPGYREVEFFRFKRTGRMAASELKAMYRQMLLVRH